MKTASLTWSPPVAAGGRAQEVPDHIIPELECGREEAHDDERQEKHEEPRDDDLPFFIVDALVSLYIDVCHAARSARQSPWTAAVQKKGRGARKTPPWRQGRSRNQLGGSQASQRSSEVPQQKKNPPLPAAPHMYVRGSARLGSLLAAGGRLPLTRSLSKAAEKAPGGFVPLLASTASYPTGGP